MELSSRSTELEIIDLGPGQYTQEEYEDCLVKLDRIGRFLGGDLATFSALKKMDPPPQSILDVGCGGGLFTIRLAQRYPNAKVVGIDINRVSIEFAKRQLASMHTPPQNVFFEVSSQEKLSEPKKSYDAVISTLVCHHLSDDNLIDFITRSCETAKQNVIINDLHRHPLAVHLFNAISPVFFRNRLIQHDGKLSILRAFKCEELRHYLKEAGLSPSQYTINWHWAFRWLVNITCKSESL